MSSLEQAPELPLLCINYTEALDAFAQIRRVHKDAHLVVMRGMRYITITDEALQVIIDRLETERKDFASVVKRYDRELEEVKKLIGSKKRGYWSTACAAPPIPEEKI
jgi:hypothetical protein